MSLGKLKQVIFGNRKLSEDSYPILGFGFSITGAGAANPTINNSHNISSITRSGVGLYRIVIDQDTMYGNSVINGIFFEKINIIPIAADTNYQMQLYKIAPDTIDIAINQITSVAANLYDLTAIDEIDMGAFIYNGAGLPPQ